VSDPNPDPLYGSEDPDPYQNLTDPQHCLQVLFATACLHNAFCMRLTPILGQFMSWQICLCFANTLNISFFCLFINKQEK
jgi:hypothetical protein